MPRPDATEERTRQIIEAAIVVFSQRGIGKTRMEDIAQEAGLSKGTLYLYFESKDALIGSILEQTISRELDQAQALLDAYISVYDKLGELAEIVVQDLREMQPLVPLYFEFMAFAIRNEEIRLTIKEQFHKFLDVLVALIDQGIARGEFRSVETRDMALAMGTIFEGTIILWAYDPDMIDIGQQIKASLTLLLEGLSKN